MRKIIIRSMAAAAIAISALVPDVSAKAKKPTVLDLKQCISDSSIVFPESFERDSRKLIEGWYMTNYTATDDRYRKLDDVPVSDETLVKRLSAMPTVIEMPFNQIVRKYIERYTKYGRQQVAAILGLSHYYMPIFEQALEEKGLPLELKYLPVIESGLDPNAVSRSGAAGLWQFMLAAAKGMGLEVNSLVDMRRDPYISSATAAALLKDLYSTYGDWSLAIAAYNCGPGTVNKAIRRAGGDASKKDFWEIYNYLPAETRGYVPMFIAANYVMTYYKDHNISPVLVTKPLVTDTVAVNKRIHFNQISKVLDIPVEELRVLNPHFRADIIPGSPEQTYFLILPSQQMHAFLMSEDEIIDTDADKYTPRGVVNPGDVADDFVAVVEESASDEEADEDVQEDVVAPRGSAKVPSNGIHKVRAGESLASIADMYGVSPEDIKAWNSLSRNAVRTGQQLRVTASASTRRSGAETRTYSLSDQAPARADVAPYKARKAVRQQETRAEEPKQKVSRKSSKDAETSKSKVRKSKKERKEKARKPVDYTIREGENLTVIARKHGVSIDELKKANGMKDDNLRAGKKIKIPDSKGAKAGKSKKKKGKASSASGKSKKKKKRK